jgi:hypothetical protein
MSSICQVSNPDGETPGCREEILTRSAAGRIANRSGWLSRLAVDAGVHRCGTRHLERGRAPGSSRHRASGWSVEDDDVELAAVERSSGAGDQWVVERVGIVRDEHDCGRAVFTAEVVDELQLRQRCARAEHGARRLEQGSRLLVAVLLFANGVAVDP